MRRNYLLLVPLLVPAILFVALWDGESSAGLEAIKPRTTSDVSSSKHLDAAGSGIDVEGSGSGSSSDARLDAEADAQAWLGPRASFDGLVADARSHAPIEGARVALVQGTLRAEVETDLEGGFAIEWPEDRIAGLEISHPDYVDMRRPNVDLDEDISISMRASGAIVGHVTVRWDLDADGAPVRLWSTRRGQVKGDPIVETTVQPNGTFRLEDLAPGVYTVGVAVEGAPLFSEPSVIVRSGVDTPLVLAVGAGERLTGRVVTGSDLTPVPGVAVTVRRGAAGVEEEVSAEALTSADGRFEVLGLTPGAFEFELHAPWGAVVTVQRTVSFEPGADEALFSLMSPARLTGQVLDAAGKAVPGARIALAVTRLAGDLEWGRPDELFAQEGESLRTTRADGAGRFELEQVAAGSKILICAYPAEGNAGSSIQTLRLDEGASHQVELRLAQTTSLSGRVVDPEGRPLPAIQVELEIAAGRDRSSFAVDSTDGAGRYHFEGVPMLRVRVQARADSYRGGAAWIDLEQSDEVEDLVLSPAFVIRGLVVDEDGWAVPGARVRARELAVEEDGERPRAGVSSTDEFGAFEVGGLGEGDFTVEASAPGHHQRDPALVVRLPGEPFVVLMMEEQALALPGTVTGEVVLAGTGGAVSGLRITGSKGSVVIDGTRFRMTGLSPGRKRLVARAPGVEDVHFDAFVITEGGGVELGRYETRTTTGVRVVVTDPTGGLVKDAKVRLVRRTKQQPRPGSAVPSKINLRLDKRKRHYESSDVGRYDWTLEVSHSKYVTVAKEIHAGEKNTYRVQLARKTSKKNRKKKKR